jgi:putative chitinase
VKDLQQQLADLGYTRANGQPLGVDGDFGSGTSHAVKAFQKDNALPVTGVADEVTRQAVDRAALEALRDLPPMPGQAPQRQAPSSNPAQRVEDALYAPLREQVYAMDRAMGRTPDEASDRVAAALCAECRANGLTRVDGVVLGQKGGSAQPGEYVFAYSGSSERPSDWVGVKTAEAVRTPVEQSLAKAETQQRQLAVEAQQMAQAQQPANDAAVRVMG